MINSKMQTLTVRRKSDDAVVAEIYIEESGEVGLVGSGYYVEASDAPSATLDDAKVSAKRTINLMAGQMRSQHVSHGHGIELVYMRKEKEAVAWDGAGRPAIADDTVYPWIWRESQALSMTPADTAIRILGRIAALDELGSQMEAVRMSANQSIDNAVQIEDVATAKMEGLQALEVFRL